MKELIQNELKLLLNKIYSDKYKVYRFSYGYIQTILKYKSILHNTPEENIKEFADRVLDDYSKEIQKSHWTYFSEGKSQAMCDMRDIVIKFTKEVK